MPAIEAMTPLGLTWRSWLPVALQDSPDHLAVLHALSRECERLEASIETVRRQFFPQLADVLLKVWEAELGLTVEPAGQTVAQRRDTVIAMLRARNSTPEGREWEEKVTQLVGPGWEYAEYLPGSAGGGTYGAGTYGAAIYAAAGGGPPANTIRIVLPFPPSSGSYALAERKIAEFTPAHIDIVLQFAGGFVLDSSQLDQEGL